MNISVLLAPYRDGFTAAIAAAVADTLEGNGHTPLLYDPHAEGFDCNACERIASSIAAASGFLTGSCSG